MTDFTLTIIKPEIVEKGLHFEILDKIVKKDFKISAMKICHLTLEQASQFYVVHKDQPYYQKLVNYMSSGPVVVAIVRKENAVAEFRQFIGNTDPFKAEKGTIRKMYATNITVNAIHGSDSDENAVIESDFFFSELERV